MRLPIPCLLAAFALSACERPAPAPTSAEAPPAANESPRVVRTVAPLPARYAADLPASSEAMAAWMSGDPSFPPEAHVVDAIVAGDDDMFARLADAASRVPADETLAWAKAWHDHLAWQSPNAAFCARARPAMAAQPSTLRLALAGSWALACADAEDRGLVLRADTPDWAVLAWYSSDRRPKRTGPMPYDARLAEVLRHALANGDAQRRAEAAHTLAVQPDPAAASDLIAVHAAIADAKLADELAELMRASPDARAFAIGREACQRGRDPRHCDERYGMGDPWLPEEAPKQTSAERGELAAQLVAAGFDRVDATTPHTGLGVPAWDLLVGANHAYWFDVETGDWPNHHDSLLRKLAALVAPALDGVVFEEVPPADTDEEGDYLLRAYVDDVRLETSADNLGDWYDVDAVLRLLDAVVLERRSPARFVALATDDQTLTIVGANAEVLSAAIARKLVEPGDVHAAEALGKQFEERVGRMLEAGEVRRPDGR